MENKIYILHIYKRIPKKLLPKNKGDSTMVTTSSGAYLTRELAVLNAIDYFAELKDLSEEEFLYYCQQLEDGYNFIYTRPCKMFTYIAEVTIDEHI